VRPALIGGVVVARVQARRAPGPSARVIDTFGRRNVQGSPQVFLIKGWVRGTGGTSWARALLPVRPNGTFGFIPARDLRVTYTPYRLFVNRKALTLTLWNRCRRVRTYPVGLGTKDTPTPLGSFYLASLLKPPTPNTVYGDYAYGLSGYSQVIRNWRWGGLVGLHGTNDPSSVGRLVSHGCIRMRNRDIDQLVRILPLGTPITIY
jgi:hypothetical protein